MELSDTFDPAHNLIDRTSADQTGLTITPNKRVERLISESTLSMLRSRNLPYSLDDYSDVICSLAEERSLTAALLDQNIGHRVVFRLNTSGPSLRVTKTLVPTHWKTVVASGDDEVMSFISLGSADKQLPRADIKLKGVGDLLVVKQHLVAYEEADVAHIENILKGALKERTHTRRTETER